tara:strand:+ start:12718 stop:17163 length:4446 start_codon:yes stop_codon:yes gene_type:complete
MPELKRVFTSGKMNKDLDERLVPPGQYRDAQNIQVSDSEGSDVGAVESIVGNTKKLKKTSSVNWDDELGLTSPKCIGVVRDTLNNKLYWFVAATDGDAILEYDESTGLTAPVIVDVRETSVLNFSENYLITGVNLIDGILFWTDDNNEPRRINISRFKSGSTQSGTDLSDTTQVYRTYDTSNTPPAYADRDFTNHDITVIKRGPQTACAATAVPSLVGGNATGITPVTTAGANFYNKPVQGELAITWTGSITWYDTAGSRFRLSTFKEQEDGTRDQYEVVGTFKSTPAATATSGTVVIESISDGVPNESLAWEMLLIEDDPIFRNDFPRFSYRYKYIDGEYSIFAPFTQAVFVTGAFEYLSRNGQNIGMESIIRKVTISGLTSNVPEDVNKIEVLYKSSNSNNISIIETIDYDPNVNPSQSISIDITSATFGRVVDSGQLLRSFDNVPIKAKAQEVIGNRIVYGNYVQNYNVDEGDVTIIGDQTNTNHAAGYNGEETVKSNREYQIGVSFLDEYGRETPIFTSTGGSVSVTSKNATKSNALKAKLNAFTAPTGISKFKYYVKDLSEDYYNLALDRYYQAEDNSVWLSFPSSERNKIKEGQHIVLKKAHDSNNAVLENNRYKVLEVSNEAPDYVRLVKVAVARANCINYRPNDTEKPFVLGDERVSFLAPLQIKNPDFYSGVSSKGYLQFVNVNNTARSKKYQIANGGPTGAEETVNIPRTGESNIPHSLFQVDLTEGIKSEDDWLTKIPNDKEIKVIVFEEQNFPAKEFIGRFFVKISANATFYDNTSRAFTDTGSDTIEDETLTLYQASNNFAQFARTVNGAQGSAIDVALSEFSEPDASTGSGMPENGSDKLRLYLSNSANTQLAQSVTHFRFQKISNIGTRIKFLFADGSKSDIYRIISSNQVAYSSQESTNDDGIKLIATLDKNFNESYETEQGTNYNLSSIKGIIIMREQNIKDQNLLSSTNPAIFETEPDKRPELDVYYEATNSIDIANIGSYQTFPYFNAYSFGNGVESDRVGDDFNAATIGKGVKANAELEEPYAQERKSSSMIYSGIINNTSSVNNTNQFSMADKITKDLNPIYGSIQKLHARDTDLIVLLEDKIFRVLANKDALYNADGNAQLTASNRVLGQATPYVGEYGISKNPESFASYGFRAYFTDKARGAVIRLSRDGITDISSKGMSDYILDAYKDHSDSKIIGSYDEDTGAYNITVDNEVLSFKENVDGWATRLTYKPEFGISLNNEYYTFKNGQLYIHNNATNRSNFYGTQYDTSVTMLFNDEPSRIKNFKTLSYEGDTGWTAAVDTDQQDGEVATWKNKEGIYYNYIRGLDSTWDQSNQTGTLDTSEFNVQGIDECSYAALNGAQTEWTIRFTNNINSLLQGWRDPSDSDQIYGDDKVYFVDASDDDKVYLIGKCIYVSDIEIHVTKDTQRVPVAGDYIFFAKNSQVNTSGIIGYYASVKMTKTGGTNKELFAVNSEIFISS